jgi:hypothetical protein
VRMPKAETGPSLMLKRIQKEESRKVVGEVRAPSEQPQA